MSGSSREANTLGQTKRGVWRKQSSEKQSVGSWSLKVRTLAEIVEFSKRGPKIPKPWSAVRCFHRSSGKTSTAGGAGVACSSFLVWGTLLCLKCKQWELFPAAAAEQNPAGCQKNPEMPSSKEGESKMDGKWKHCQELWDWADPKALLALFFILDHSPNWCFPRKKPPKCWTDNTVPTTFQNGGSEKLSKALKLLQWWEGSVKCLRCGDQLSLPGPPKTCLLFKRLPATAHLDAGRSFGLGLGCMKNSVKWHDSVATSLWQEKPPHWKSCFPVLSSGLHDQS